MCITNKADVIGLIVRVGKQRDEMVIPSSPGGSCNRHPGFDLSKPVEEYGLIQTEPAQRISQQAIVRKVCLYPFRNWLVQFFKQDCRCFAQFLQILRSADSLLFQNRIVSNSAPGFKVESVSTVFSTIAILIGYNQKEDLWTIPVSFPFRMPGPQRIAAFHVFELCFHSFTEILRNLCIDLFSGRGIVIDLRNMVRICFTVTHSVFIITVNTIELNNGVLIGLIRVASRQNGNQQMQDQHN